MRRPLLLRLLHRRGKGRALLLRLLPRSRELDELDQCTEGLLSRHPKAKNTDAVFLTGGSSQIPAVRHLYVSRFGEARVRTADVFTSVAEGLGRAAAHLDS